MNVLLSLNTILLTGGSQNLFDPKWTEGNLYKIQGIVNVLASVSVWVLSVVGFGIVIFSILKNAMSGLYVVNPTFWDKVSDIKNQAVANTSGVINDAANKVTGNGSYMAQKLGGLFTFLLNLIPNVRALTDFDDGAPVDKKQYFMRSLPLLVFQIFIGMFIFFGYPSKIADWIGEGARYAMDACLNNIDPVETIQGISDSITVYNLATDGSPLAFDKTVNKATVEMLKTVQTKYRDMKKDPTQETAYYLESFLQKALAEGGAGDILGAEEGYDISIVTTSMSGVPSIADAFSMVSHNSAYPLVRAQAVNGIVQYKTWISGATLPTGSAKVGDGDYFVWTITATPVAVSKTSSASLIMCAGLGSTPTQETGGIVNITLNGFQIGSADGCLRGTPGPVSVDIVNTADGTVKQSTSAKLQTTDISNTERANAVLTFDKATWAAVGADINSSGVYLRVSLPGNWTMDVKSGTGSTSVTTNVGELRLSKGTSSCTYALSMWSDFTLKDYTASCSTPDEALKKGSNSGTAE